jgi:sugar O-acyltransferase (sialic acid O-acetyltransferase NeuD family)
MTDLFPVQVPLVNPNENESLLAQLCVHNGQKVRKGELLAVFETTKSTLELLSEREGYVLGLTLKEGETLPAGKHLCFIAPSSDAVLPEEKTVASPEKTNKEEVPQGLRITQPALALARQLGVDLSTLPLDCLITETYLKASNVPLEVNADPNALIIYGGGGHAKSLIDLIRAEGKYSIAGIVDDGLQPGSQVMGVAVLGNGSVLAELRSKGIARAVNAVGGIGSITPRLAVYEKLRAAGFTCPTVVHPRAYIEPGAKIGEGCQVFFNAYIGSEVTLGFGCIVNTGAIISHDCTLGDYVNISPGAILAGSVMVGERSLIGMGVTINLHVAVGAGARVGNSAVVKEDVPANGVVRAGALWPAERAD